MSNASGGPGPRVRLLCLLPNLDCGGVQFGALEFLARMDRTRFSPELYVLAEPGLLASHLPPGLPVEFCVDRGQASLADAPRLLLRLRERALRCDLVFAMQEMAPAYLGVLASLLAGRPSAVWIRNHWTSVQAGLNFWHRAASRLLLPRATSLIGVSEGVVTDLAAWLRLPRARFQVVRSPVFVDEVRARAAGPVPDWVDRVTAKPTVVSCGRLTAQKGFDLLLEAFARAVRAGADAHLLILGEGEERAALEAQGRALGLEGRLFMPGFAAEPFPILRRASLFVLSSRYEGLARVLTEAMALELPVLAMDCPAGTLEALEGGRWGALVPQGDVDALGREMARLLGEPSELQRLAREGLARARQMDGAAAVKRMEQVLLEAAGVPDNS